MAEKTFLQRELNRIIVENHIGLRYNMGIEGHYSNGIFQQVRDHEEFERMAGDLIPNDVDVFYKGEEI